MNKEIELSGGPPWGFRTTSTTSLDHHHKIKIARVNPCSKASESGMRDGDLVLKINGENTDNLSSTDVQKMIKGNTLTLQLRTHNKINTNTGVGEAGTSGQAKPLEPVANQSLSLSDDRQTSTAGIGDLESGQSQVKIISVEKKVRKSESKKVKKSSPSKKKGQVVQITTDNSTPGQDDGNQRDPTGGSAEAWRTQGPTLSDDIPALLKQQSESSSLEEEPILPVWTPPSQPSPSTQKKFRPVPFQLPCDSNQQNQTTNNKNNKDHQLTLDLQTNFQDPLSPSLDHHQNQSVITSPDSSHSQVSLPKYPSPTVTLLQKAREGQLPKGAHYLEEEIPTSRPPPSTVSNISNQSFSSANVNRQQQQRPPPPQELKPILVRSGSGSDIGIGPTTPDGVPLTSKSVLSDDQQHEWYKRMYESIHVERPRSRQQQLIRKSGGGPPAKSFWTRQTSGAQSEPEYSYDSDYGTLDRRKLGALSPGNNNDSTVLSPGIRFTTPGRIEDYTPGRSGTKEVKKYRPVDCRGSLQHWATKELGYESDSYVIRKRTEELDSRSPPPPPPFSPAEQRQLYVDIQKGGEVPLQGLRKLAPDRFNYSSRDLHRPRSLPTFSYSSVFYARMNPSASRMRSLSPPSPSPSGAVTYRSISPSSLTKVSMLQTRIQEKLNRSQSDLTPSAMAKTKQRSTSASRLIRSVRSSSNSSSTSNLRSLSQSYIPILQKQQQGNRNNSINSVDNISNSNSQSDLQSPKEVKKVLRMNNGALTASTAVGGQKLSIKLEVTKGNNKKIKEIISISTGDVVKRASKLKKQNGHKSTTSSGSGSKSVKISDRVSVQNGGSQTLNNGNGSVPQKPPRKSKTSSTSSASSVTCQGGDNQAKVGKSQSGPSSSVGRHLRCLSPLSNATSRSTSPGVASTTITTTSGNLYRAQRGSSVERSSIKTQIKPVYTSTKSSTGNTAERKQTATSSSNKSMERKLIPLKDLKDGKCSSTSSSPNRIKPTTATTTPTISNTSTTNKNNSPPPTNTKAKVQTKPISSSQNKSDLEVEEKELESVGESSKVRNTTTRGGNLTQKEVNLSRFSSLRSLPSFQMQMQSKSMPTLTPYLSETKRVSNSIFILKEPRPTKTSLLREIISREQTPQHSQQILSIKTSPNGNRTLARSHSCMTLPTYENYPHYILQLRHCRSKSPRFTKLTKLYSSLERLSMLERSTSLYNLPVLPIVKQHDFDAWWKVRNRLRIEREMSEISCNLLQAQKEREFFFKPMGRFYVHPWRPYVDSRLRFKKFTVEEIKSFLLRGHEGVKGHELDIYKTHWRGTSVKELALNLEVNDIYKQKYYEEQMDKEFYSKTPFLRRAFSMSSTLSNEQRELIKSRIGRLIIKNNNNNTQGHSREEVKSEGKETQRRVVTSRMGFTTSSDPYKPDDMTTSSSGGGGILTESAKKQLSRTLSQEFKDRKIKDSNFLRNTFTTTLGDSSTVKMENLPISTKIALSHNSGSVLNKKGPFYSVYCKNGVNDRVKIFENGSSEEKVAKIVKTQDYKRPISPYRTLSPQQQHQRQRSPSPKLGGGQRSRSVTPDANRKYMSHLNIISKLASFLLKKDTPLKNLVTREVLERDKLERLRYLNSGEVNRLRDYFEAHGDLHGFNSPEISLLRCLFCSDPNLSKVTENYEHTRRCKSNCDLIEEEDFEKDRARPEGSSPSPELYFSKRSRKPIYEPSSTPNVCQPTLTAHCHLECESPSGADLDNNYYSSLDNSYSSAMRSFSPVNYHQITYPSYPNYPPPPPPPTVTTQGQQPPLPSVPQRRILDHRLGQKPFLNFDPSLHQPRFRYVPDPPNQTHQQPMQYYSEQELTSLPLIGLPPVPPLPQNNRLSRSESFKSFKSCNSSSYSNSMQRGSQWSPSSVGARSVGGGSSINTRRDQSDGTSRPASALPFSPNYGCSTGQETNERPPSSIDNEIRQIESQFFDANNHAQLPSSPAIRYNESSVNIHYRAPIRLEEKDFVKEDELRRRQEVAMKKFYEEQRHRKFMKEIQDLESRRHSDHFVPSQKSPIPLNRYDSEDYGDDFADQPSRPKWKNPSKQLARALFNFVPQNERELRLSKGDILVIRRKLDANWYEGEHDSAQGIFPASYVQILTPEEQRDERTSAGSVQQMTGLGMALYNFAASTPIELSIIKGERVILTRRVDSNWFECRIGSRRGICPASYLQVVRPPGLPAKGSSKSPKPVGTPAARSMITTHQNFNGAKHNYKPNEFVLNDYGEIGDYPRSTNNNTRQSSRYTAGLTIDTRAQEPIKYRSLYNYRPAHEDELELREDDIINVLEKCDDGWFVGTSSRTGLFGTFPGNYVQRDDFKNA